MSEHSTFSPAHPTSADLTVGDPNHELFGLGWSPGRQPKSRTETHVGRHRAAAD